MKSNLQRSGVGIFSAKQLNLKGWKCEELQYGKVPRVLRNACSEAY